MAELEQVFAAFADGKPDMDGKTFVKLCKDCKLLDKKLTATDVDLIFAKVAPKGQRRISLMHFDAALQHLATKKATPLEEVRSLISRSQGPALSGTQADAVRFHDDKSTYTGTHVNGGPERVSKGTGTATQLASSGMGAGQGGGSGATRPPSRSGVRRASEPSRGAVPAVKIPAGVFESVCRQLRTSELFGPSAARALEAAAEGATWTPPGTKATELRTKVADARGDLETALARSEAEVEELRKVVAQKDEAIAQLRRDVGKISAAPSAEDEAATARRPSKGPAAQGPPTQGPAAAAAPAASLQHAFSAFADGKPDMDQKSFVKLCKDVKLVDKGFTTTDADLIFAKVVTKGQRRIDFGQFSAALDQVAAKKGISAEATRDAVCRAGGPTLNGTVADHVKFHDDKSTYTGTHVNGGPESVGKGAGTATQLASSRMATGQ